MMRVVSRRFCGRLWAHCELGFAEREVSVTEAGGEGPRKRLRGPVRRAEASRKGCGACVSGRVVTAYLDMREPSRPSKETRAIKTIDLIS